MSDHIQAKLNQWDYLIVTASNDAQAQAYESQLKIRQELGFLSDVCQVMVVADPGGKRIGSGGSTLYCLMQVLQRRLGKDVKKAGVDVWEKLLGELRILIIHAGGDSRRLPAYGPCGKIFVPVPGEYDGAINLSLFDRQLPIFLALPEPVEEIGQVVITSGDILLRFDPASVQLATEGVTGLACYALPKQASRHGVFCIEEKNKVRQYLQKPSIEEQKEKGAIDLYGQACLDIGVMNFDAATAVKLLGVFGVKPTAEGQLAWSGKLGDAIVDCGLDFYREICCAMGSDADMGHHLKSARGSGSKWSQELLSQLFDVCSGIPFNVQLLKHCDFLDFGANRSVINSGMRLLQEDRGASSLHTCLDINNQMLEGGNIAGGNSWVEGCRIGSSLSLGGENLVVGVDVDEPISLPERACLDVIKGSDRENKDVWFVRCYGLDDEFKAAAGQGASFCGRDVIEWLEIVGAGVEDVWDEGVEAENKSIWNARLFPAIKKHNEYLAWLWMYEPAKGTKQEHQAWLGADRYSLEEILAAANHGWFYSRRKEIRSNIIRERLRHIFRPGSRFSALELAYLLMDSDDLSAWVAQILSHGHWHFTDGDGFSLESLVFPRIIHTLGSALLELEGDKDIRLAKAMPGLDKLLSPAVRDWLGTLGLELDSGVSLSQWATKAQNIAFESLGRTVVSSGAGDRSYPHSVLRSDEIVWARAPARVDIGGGWTDTPPHSLEHGGCVVNAAIDMNGQPPIQAYVRVIKEKVIRIGSIDLGERIEITELDQLLDYQQVGSGFALAKAALVLSGLSDNGTSLKKMLAKFGGGIELTTLAAIPKGSGLGTSSIMGAVIVAAVERMMGRQLTQRQLFHRVLQLEQALTTGGGWQDQIGGVVDGVKMIVAEPGLVPDARIHYMPPDVLAPGINGGQTLLYYTGITRLAKNILQQVVGRYLNRDRQTMATLRQIGLVAHEVTESLICKDIARFGYLIDRVWQLNKQLDPNSSTDEIESLLERIGPNIYGAKLLGAGGGGFLLIVCRSVDDAMAVREKLETEPTNERGRFFDFGISNDGLTVSVC